MAQEGFGLSHLIVHIAKHFATGAFSQELPLHLLEQFQLFDHFSVPLTQFVHVSEYMFCHHCELFWHLALPCDINYLLDYFEML